MTVVVSVYERATNELVGTARVTGETASFFGPDGEPDDHVGRVLSSFQHHWWATHRDAYRGMAPRAAFAASLRDALLNSPPVYGPLRLDVRLPR